MAYTSVIPVRRLDRTVDYVQNKEKTTPKSLEEAVDYAANRDKTESACFETGLGCTTTSAFEDMRLNTLRWHKETGVQGYHLVQSFAEGEVTPELAHQIGVEFAEQLLHGKYQAIVTTHLNTKHLQDRYLYDYTFANDNGQNPLMDKARAYVENWKEAYKSNIGLLLFGDVGTGKSFFAGCIANALLDQDVPVLMTNFPTILNRLTGMFSEDRADFIASFDEYDLLIIDDLGVERSTEYAMEQMFFVIDSRYRSRRPMIITTNLKLSELKNPPDLAHARIYDRILERCAPILFDGKNFREENAGATRQAAKDIVSSKQD